MGEEKTERGYIASVGRCGCLYDDLSHLGILEIVKRELRLMDDTQIVLIPHDLAPPVFTREVNIGLRNSLIVPSSATNSTQHPHQHTKLRTRKLHAHDSNPTHYDAPSKKQRNGAKKSWGLTLNSVLGNFHVISKPAKTMRRSDTNFRGALLSPPKFQKRKKRWDI
jgi:hypothetical protein